jgi:hypothetical protein
VTRGWAAFTGAALPSTAIPLVARINAASEIERNFVIEFLKFVV